VLDSFGWKIESTSFEGMDWESGGAFLLVGDQSFEVFPSPYSLGCEIETELCVANSLSDLYSSDVGGKLLLLYGEIAREQLMPKHFKFFNPQEHQEIIATLEEKKPAAILSATSRNPSLAGGVYPFPLIEDGDFDIPSVYMTETEGKKLVEHNGKKASLRSRAYRIPGTGYNVVGRKQGFSEGRIVVTAHIDAKKGTPGAIDNATGVVVLLLLAELFENYAGENTIELVAFNGEDYYSAPGQLIYLNQNQGQLSSINLNINIDGAGYHQGSSSVSFYNVPDHIQACVMDEIGQFPGIIQGTPWPQGDHSIFAQQGVSAIAFTSQWYLDNMESQDVTHTPKDNPSIVACDKVVEIAHAIVQLIQSEIFLKTE
jgi:aminopeptidase YwaD